MRAVLISSLVVGAGLLLGGCASTGSKQSWVRTGDALVDGRTAIAEGRPEDKVLWQYRTALVAMRRGEYEEAKRLLDDALLSLGGVPTDERSARKARSYFSEESSKQFRGEPYERAMAFFYRGILYWMDGEYDNARACFRNAQFIDSDAESNEYAGDFVLMDYLDGLATAKLAGDGSDALKRARANARLDVPPPYEKEANTFFFIEFGQGPVKYSSGEHGEQLRFRSGRSEAQSVRVSLGEKVVRLGPYDDLTYQATTRGGRVMDHILANKAVFKKTTDNVGNAALLGGIVVANRHQEVGLGLVAAGLLGKMISSATTPRADTRAWDNLPQYLSFSAWKVPPGEYEATVEFLDGSGRPIAGRTDVVQVRVEPGDENNVFFVSDRRRPGGEAASWGTGT